MKHPVNPRPVLRQYACRGALLGMLAVLAGGSGTAAAAPSGSEPADLMPQVEVTGERAGPRLWRVAKGDHVLWLLGTLDPLPRHMTWKSREVESVLGEVQAVIPTNPSVSVHANPITWIRLYFQWRGVQKLEGDAKLKDVLPPALYGRLMTLVARYDAGDHNIERLKPVFAALRLYRGALDFAHLAPGNQAEATVVKLARSHKVPIQQSKVAIDDPRDLVSQLGQIPREAQISCLEAIVERLEGGTEPLRQEANAWALGDVAALRRLSVPRTIEVCTAAVSSASRARQLIEESDADWNREVELALTNNRSTLALKPIHDLLGPNGALGVFRSRGYLVEGP